VTNCSYLSESTDTSGQILLSYK